VLARGLSGSLLLCPGKGEPLLALPLPPHLLLCIAQSHDAWACGSHPVSMRQQAQEECQFVNKDEAERGRVWVPAGAAEPLTRFLR
jgi:hypothetical protein